MIDPEIVHSLKGSRGRRMADDWEEGIRALVNKHSRKLEVGL